MKFLRAYMSDITEKTLFKKITQQRDSIVDSLNYAKYIQRSYYPISKRWKIILVRILIYSIPKDIVGGDFYWFKTFGGKSNFDCCRLYWSWSSRWLYHYVRKFID